MRVSTYRRKTQGGQALLLVVVALGIFLLGAVGLAIDGSTLYGQRQMAQAAADAAATAGIVSMFDGTNGSGTHGFSTSSSFTCSTSDARTPCYYAQTLNGFNSASDTVTIDFPSAATVSVPSGKLSSSDSPNLLRASVSRQVPTTFLQLIGPSAATVTAAATAAIVSVQAPVPILVTHPNLSGALSANGTGSTAKIKICGGPSKSIQVNSGKADGISVSGSGVIDLSHAGPADTAGDCTTGTGADFGNWGGPNPSGFTLQLGTTGHYRDPADWVEDPLKNVSAPSQPTASGTTGTLAAGSNGCPTGSGGCTLYYPGNWTSDIKVKNQNAVFAPGIYYMNGTNFTIDANGVPFMATGLTDSSTSQTVATCCGTSTSWGGSGTTQANMLVYLTGTGSAPVTTGSLSIVANAGGTVGGVTSFLQGSPIGSSYKGILFWVDRNAKSQTSSIDGGATISMTGTIYMTPTRANMLSTPGTYDTLSFQGNGSGTTLITGEIVVSALSLGGTPGIVMNLNSSVNYNVRQVALVQ